MALDLQRAAQRRTRILVIVLAVAVALLIGVVVGLVAGGSGDGSEASPTPTSPPDGNAETEDPGEDPDPDPSDTPSGSDYVAPEEWVQLPPGSSEAEGGLPVGFPQTSEGAIAMVAASSRNAWTWDAEQMERGIRAYASDADRDAALDVTEESANGVRDYIGIPDGEPIPDDAMVNGWPIGVQWEDQDDGSVRVTLLIRVTFTPGNGEPTETHLIATVNDAIWQHDDWKIASVPPDVAQDTPTAADLGTPAFNAEGWIAIQEGDVR
jgi:hypothetical protein